MDLEDGVREIKFRAWDGESVRYDVTGFEHGFENEMCGIFLDGDFYRISGAKSSVSEPCAIPMQFAELYDKNGKEFYEGDIAKKLHCEAGEVIFSGGAFRVNVKTRKGLRAYNLTQETAGISEIIGNIYENPELLDPKEAL